MQSTANDAPTAAAATATAPFDRPPITLREMLGVCGLCIIVLLAYLSTLNYPMQRCDDIYYVIGAKSLAAGVGYADISRPDAPFLTKYAPLPSVTLAPFVEIVGDHWRLLRIVSMVWSLLCVLPLYPLLRDRTSHRGAMLILTLTLLNPIALHGNNLQGNAAFGAAILLSVVYLLDRRYPKHPTVSTLLLLAAALTLAFYTHRANITLIIGATAYLGFRFRRPRAAAAVLVLVAALCFPWMWRSYTHTGHWISQDYEAEIAGRNDLSDTAPRLTGPLNHMVENLRTTPAEIGHGLWPWSKASGGQFWPGLAKYGLSWMQPVTLGGIFILTIIGWAVAWRKGPRFPEWQLPIHLAMMLFFFIGFQYFGLFVPFFYLYLWRGATASFTFLRTLLPFLPVLTPARRRVFVLLGFWLLFLPIIGKDIKVYWGNSHPNMQDRDRRWTWVAQQVPEGQGVYWHGLENYSWAPWRWFDSGRTAVGITDAEMEKAITRSQTEVRYLSLPSGTPWETRLRKSGWQPMFLETDMPPPPPVQVLEMLTPAQRAYLAQMPPPQTLWYRHP